jgi:hypothetical protein
MPSGAITLAAVAQRTAVLSVACTRCERAGGPVSRRHADRPAWCRVRHSAPAAVVVRRLPEAVLSQRLRPVRHPLSGIIWSVWGAGWMITRRSFRDMKIAPRDGTTIEVRHWRKQEIVRTRWSGQEQCWVREDDPQHRLLHRVSGWRPVNPARTITKISLL